jgi:hypothetical protein
MVQIKKHASNIHEFIFEGKESKIAMLSDLHWDNPKCDWTILKKHLDYCVSNSIPVHINGDFFCLMQGRGDRRSSKSDIRPEHNNARYLDSVIETAVEWFEPYKDVIKLINYGNHETAIIKWQETDLLRRFVDLFNMKHKVSVELGGYGGWMIVTNKITTTAQSSFKGKYFHGSGGGGIVTKGAINLTRALETYDGFDFFTMGHIHENACRNDVRDTIEHNSKVGYRHLQKEIHMMITGSYKEEYGDGSKGWHVERGAPVKPVGGRIASFSVNNDSIDGVRVVKKQIDSMKFPI